MANFILTCVDKPGGLDVRLANREKHFAYLSGHPGVVRLGGPFLDDEGRMVGSMLIIEVADRAAAEAFAAADPYAAAGLFERVDIRAWRATVGALA